jgi:hypothetical protein
MNDLLHDLLLVVLVWLLLTYWSMWEISQQKGHPTTKKGPRRHRKGSTEPKPFPGLTRKPDCPFCEDEAGARASIPEPPLLMQSQRGAPSSVDTSRQFCPQDTLEA